MEMIEGISLQRFIIDELKVNQGTRGIHEKKAKSIFHDIIKGVDFLHSKGIAHRDIKLDNIMLKYDNKSNQTW